MHLHVDPHASATPIQWSVAKEEQEKNSLPQFNHIPCRLSGAVQLLEKDLSRCQKVLVWSVPDLTHATATNQTWRGENLKNLKLTITNKTHFELKAISEAVMDGRLKIISLVPITSSSQFIHFSSHQAWVLAHRPVSEASAKGPIAPDETLFSEKSWQATSEKGKGKLHGQCCDLDLDLKRLVYAMKPAGWIDETVGEMSDLRVCYRKASYIHISIGQ
ncbi:hypothetical protein EDB82DRAFT_480713 [Fusarium venenatum]|uniref:uncharacterized protein n=1 Tax=Fusarium venenatum TaxID=56646 RepID=UPI001D729F75|nr:hypothetical protein EDB82DRAFT_480713 [Fusarium venenatum]